LELTEKEKKKKNEKKTFDPESIFRYFVSIGFQWLINDLFFFQYDYKSSY